jgi:hypothetical protein
MSANDPKRTCEAFYEARLIAYAKEMKPSEWINAQPAFVEPEQKWDPTLLVPRRFGFAAKASWSAALQFRRHGHRSHELKADQGEAGPCNLGIGYASKFIVVAC